MNPMSRSAERRRGGHGPSRTVGAANVRAHNREVVLRLVWTERQLSRAEVARRTGLSRSTVSNIVDELFETGLLRDAGEGRSIGGKRPKLMAFRDDVYGIVGVDLGASHIGVALTNLRGEVVHWAQIAHDVRDDPEGTLVQLTELVVDAVNNRPRGMRRAVGIGLAVPTPLDPAHPNVFSPRVLPAWRQVRLAETLEKRFGVRVLADNDANVGALAERWWGAGTDGLDLAFIKVATGIGCGMIVDGAIHRGARFLAGEIGHVSVDPSGPDCSCGQRGCLVNYVGAPALVARANALCAGRTRAFPDLQAVIAAAMDGDPVADRAIAEAAEHLSVAIWSLVNMVNPATVVLGGTLAAAGERLLVPVSSALLSHHRWTSDAQTRIVLSELGEAGIALGAATLVLDHALADPELFAAKLSARSLG